MFPSFPLFFLFSFSFFFFCSSLFSVSFARFCLTHIVFLESLKFSRPFFHSFLASFFFFTTFFFVRFLVFPFCTLCFFAAPLSYAFCFPRELYAFIHVVIFLFCVETFPLFLVLLRRFLPERPFPLCLPSTIQSFLRRINLPITIIFYPAPRERLQTLYYHSRVPSSSWPRSPCPADGP